MVNSGSIIPTGGLAKAFSPGFCRLYSPPFAIPRAFMAVRSAPPVGIIMGSQSDWSTLKTAADMLAALGVAHETRIVSAHRTPDRMAAYAKDAEARGIRVIIAGAGGAAHLPGMVASMTTLPVLGVPVESRALKGLDSLLSIAQMPGGVPVATFAIGEAGAKNAALHAAAILGLSDGGVKKKLDRWRARQTRSVAKSPR
jgi:5-(carboxyamino)imidazole ribonucleotide mutase